MGVPVHLDGRGSLKTSGELFGGGLGLVPETLRWENYSRAWTDGQFARYLRNTVVVTLATTAIVVVRCALAGYVIGRYRFPGSRLVIGIFVATLFVPTGYTIIPIVKVSLELGLLNSLTGMILALSGASNVAAILIYAGYFRGTAATRGSRHRRRRRVLPRLREDHAAVVHAGHGDGGDPDVPGDLERLLPAPGLLVQQPGPADRERRHAGIRRGELDRLAGHGAAGVISILPVVLLFIFMQKYFVEGIAGAVKS